MSLQISNPFFRVLGLGMTVKRGTLADATLIAVGPGFLCKSRLDFTFD
jgi:hypothetical protein